MTTTFDCPTCGAPLIFIKNAETICCSYCRNSVIVPPELRQSRPYDSKADDDESDPSETRENSQERMINAVVFLARSGTDGEAIRYYSQLTGCSQADARQVVENIKAGIMPPGYDSSSSQDDSVNLTIQQVRQIQRFIHSGQKTEAINFYREIADCSRTKAEQVVTKMASGLS